MRRIQLCAALACVLLVAIGCKPAPPSQLLIFSHTAGYRHASIEAGAESLKRLAENHDLIPIHTEDPNWFTEDSLASVAAVVFLNTTGDVLNAAQQSDFERYIQAGGGYLGIHSASDTEYDWPWYGQLVGAYFESHPQIQPAEIQVTDRSHLATRHLPAVWSRADEWYNFVERPTHVDILASIDEDSYNGGTMDGDHPVVWSHEYDGGRAFYTAMGHTEESFSDSLFLGMLDGAISWIVGNNKRNYSKARTARFPDTDRFNREILATSLHEPMELEVLDEFRIAFVERAGRLRLFNRETGALTTAAEIPVYTGQEDGLIGITRDPQFEDNGYVYLFYSPVLGDDEQSRQHVSRFTMVGDELDLDSEVVVLEIPTQRDECCHSGGSLEFDSEGNLFISVGDDTNPFASDGYAPIDEREGRAPWDAQRSAANTNDLRGKILRIRPEADGSYSIPDGNLFAPGTDGTRPEIFTMGLRNPYRISIDPYTGYLYWGDVGPDAGEDSPDRGPRGYDQIHQARGPGFFGWPYVRGNRQPYNDYDFAQALSGEPFNPDAPINESPNNTGLSELPPVAQPFVWYPYGESAQFPWTGEGGRTAMAGPVFESSAFPDVPGRFPDYFDGKLIAYEWMRDWIVAITLSQNGDFERADPILTNTAFSNPTDMAFGPDGSLYVLEYGEEWFAQNEDARLNRITFAAGNRPPTAYISTPSLAGALPFVVRADASASTDPDDDALEYNWSLDGETLDGADSAIEITLTEPGEHRLSVMVTDADGLSGRASVDLVAGNDPPAVNLRLTGNQQFFWPRRRLNWTTSVIDSEDGTRGSGISDEQITALLLVEPYDGQRSSPEAIPQEEQSYAGAELINSSDCAACHALDRRINGPSWREVAAKYTLDDVQYLTNRIITGGTGVWGETAMAAHPQLTTNEVETIVNYILSTGRPANSQPVPPDGSMRLGTDVVDATQITLTATYTDAGAAGARALTATSRKALVSPRMQAERANVIGTDVTVAEADGATMLGGLSSGRHVGWRSVDLTEMRAIVLRLHFSGGLGYEGEITVHSQAPDGPLLGSVKVAHRSSKPVFRERQVTLDASKLTDHERGSLYFVFNSDAEDQYVANLDYIELRAQ